MNQVNIREIAAGLEEKYFLIKKRSFWYFMGGFIAFLVATFLVSYKTIMNRIEDVTGAATISQLEANVRRADSANRHFTALVNELNSFELVNRLPKGTILGWYSDNIPAGWMICNGQSGTPNLNNRFPMGTDGAATLGQTGGAAEHTHICHNLWNDGVQDKWNANGNHNDPGAAGMLHSHILDPSSNIPPFAKIIFIMKVRD